MQATTILTNTALVVSKVGQGKVAKGFFLQARTLGREPSFGEDDHTCYEHEFAGALKLLKP
jgi:hypothetical protein